MSRKNTPWNSERIEALKRCFEAGLSCSVTAREIGVTRNAVIGKMNRLGLTRSKETIARPRKREPWPRRAGIPAGWRRQRVRPIILAQQKILKAAFAASPLEETPICDGRGCTLLELGQERCRWPISTPGAADFCFCGNPPVKGLPYCPGHARLAYRPGGPVRSSDIAPRL